MSDDLGTPHLRFERRGPIGWCTIDRPDARNALTASMYFGIRKAVDLVNADPELGALVITGVGDVFAPGGEMGGRHDEGRVNVGALMGMDVLPFKAIRNSAAAIVAAVACSWRSVRPRGFRARTEGSESRLRRATQESSS